MAPIVQKTLSTFFHPGVVATGSPFGDGPPKEQTIAEDYYSWLYSRASGKKAVDEKAIDLGNTKSAFDEDSDSECASEYDEDDLDLNKPLPPLPLGIESAKAPVQRMDGGLEAWLQVLGSWLLFINTWGLTNSYGTFQTYYSSGASPLGPSSSASSLAWIGSIQSFLTMFMGTFSGPLLDAGHLRAALVAGTCLEVGGLLATSFSTKLWQLFLFQGVTVGMGSGMLSTASLAIIPLYFKEKKMTASGIAASGSAVAGIGLPVLLRNLFPTIGYAWSVRVYALIVFTLLSTACLLIKPRPSQKSSGPMFNIAIFKDRVYTCWVMAYMFMVSAAYVPLFYIGDYALALGVESSMAAYVLSIMNCASLVGRLPPSILADKIGPINVLVPSALGTLTIAYCFQGVENLAGIIAIGICYCLMTSGMVSLPPMTITQLAKDPSEYGTRIGMGYTVASIGALLGSPLAGLALSQEAGPKGHAVALSTDAARAAYRGVWLVAGSSMAVSCGLMVLVRFMVAGRKWRAKV